MLDLRFPCIGQVNFEIFAILQSLNGRCLGVGKWQNGIGPPGKGGGGEDLDPGKAGAPATTDCNLNNLLYPWEQIPPHKMIHYTTGKLHPFIKSCNLLDSILYGFHIQGPYICVPKCNQAMHK